MGNGVCGGECAGFGLVCPRIFDQLPQTGAHCSSFSSPLPGRGLGHPFLLSEFWLELSGLFRINNLGCTHSTATQADKTPPRVLLLA